MIRSIVILLEHIYAAWYPLDTALKSALIAACATGVAASIGFSAIFLQIRSQGRQSRASIAENERRKIKASMYDDALHLSRVMSDTAIELSNELRMMEMQLRVASQSSAAGSPFNLPSARLPALNRHYGEFSDAAIKVIFLIEGYRIIDPRLTIFRSAISSVLHDTRNIMFSDSIMSLMPILPVDNPNGGIFPYSPPSLMAVDAASQLVAKFIDALGDAIAYAEDFQVDLQNLLLGDLFDHKLPPRNPPDPSKKAITVNKHDELEEWLRETTDWGKNYSNVEAEAVARFALQSEPLNWLRALIRKMRESSRSWIN